MSFNFRLLRWSLLTALAINCIIAPTAAQNYPRPGRNPMRESAAAATGRGDDSEDETSYKMSYLMERQMEGDPIAPPLPEEPSKPSTPTRQQQQRQHGPSFNGYNRHNDQRQHGYNFDSYADAYNDRRPDRHGPADYYQESSRSFQHQVRPHVDTVDYYDIDEPDYGY